MFRLTASSFFHFSILLLAGYFTVARADAQLPHHDSLTAEELKTYKEQCRRLVSYLEFAVNTIGDPGVAVKEKEIIINQSYSKIFRDPNVQIEDDLDMNRTTVTNKDVQAYLKDIGFFYRKVHFNFLIDTIVQQYTEAGGIYFLATLDRHLQGVTLDGDTVNNSRVRYVEINLDYGNQDLKMVSVYTTKLSEEEEVANWWHELSGAWKRYFIRYDTLLGDTTVRAVTDTLAGDDKPFYQHIRQLWSLTGIDISGNTDIRTLEPLRKLTSLRSLNIANTAIGDLTSIRNLTTLESLNCSGTPVLDLQPLYYCSGLKELNISNTRFDSLGIIGHFTALQYLNCDNTPVADLEPLAALPALTEFRGHNSGIVFLSPLENLLTLTVIDLSNNPIDNLVPMRGLVNLTYLNIGNTMVSDLGPLKNMRNLRFLYMDYTPVGDLTPLTGLTALERVYCDHSLVTREMANTLIQQKHGILVVYDSGELASWWNALPAAWKSEFSSVITVDTVPTREQLHEITQIQTIDIGGDSSILSLEPLRKLINLTEVSCPGTSIASLAPLKQSIHLQVLNASGTPVTDLQPLKNLPALKRLDLSGTVITDISPLAGLLNLEELKIENTKVSNIVPLSRLDNLKLIRADGTLLDNGNVNTFMDADTMCLILWQTARLQTWWNDLPQAWQKLFGSISNMSPVPTSEQLHDLAALECLTIKENRDINDLQPLTMLTRLRTLTLSNLPVRDLKPLGALQRLEALDCSDDPVQHIAPLTGLAALTSLNIANTHVEDLELTGFMTGLRILNISGLPVKNLKFIAALTNLREIDIHNTRVSSFKYLWDLPRLTTVKCYNTALNEKEVAKFKQDHPGIQVIFY